MTDWRLAEAKNRFSELVTRALAEGPQRVRRHDAAVVVLAEQDYNKLTRRTLDFKQFLLAKGPSLEGLDLTREHTPPRQVKL
jgi:predicted Zn-dependent protease with MMP-like domain